MKYKHEHFIKTNHTKLHTNCLDTTKISIGLYLGTVAEIFTSHEHRSTIYRVSPEYYFHNTKIYVYGRRDGYSSLKL